MNSDHYFSIGSTHKTCEDYSLSGSEIVKGLAFGIVADGCSASHCVDVGARVLAHSALFITREEHDSNPNDFGHYLISQADQVISYLPSLHQTCLDSTLLAVFTHEDKSRVLMYGDGVCVIRKKDYTLIYHVEYQSGAPYYLSYSLDPLRNQAYETQFKDKYLILTKVKVTNPCPVCSLIYTGGGAGDGITHEFLPFGTRIDLSFQAEPGDVYSVISDGINSFRREDSTLISWMDLIDEFTGYKNTNGSFVDRRMKFFKRDCEKKMIVNEDDISVASIVI